LPVGAELGCEDRLEDDNVNEVDTDVEVDVNWFVADVEPSWLAELRRDEDGGARELLLLLVALALDP
jgi:hypothetical protein